MRELAGQNILRIAAVAVGLSTLSFAAGVAGDLSIIDPPRSGQSVVLRIPPEIPADAPRAGPLLSTASAQATPVRLARHARRTELRSLVEAVQAAHEETFELTPIGLEAAPARSQKPQVYAQVKPTREAPSEPHETKVA
jgi:hypothetical protein